MLEGRLVNLRAWGPADAPLVQRWINDREVTQFLGSRYPQSLAFEEGWVAERAAKTQSFGEVRFVIETKDGVSIGNMGLHDASPEDRSAWLGVTIGEKEYWSKGYGSDALMTLLRFAFEEMNLNRVSLDVYDFNERGQASYRKCGFVEEGRRRHARYQRGTYHDKVAMAILRDEWEAIR
jgi:RimJ/RimL family protein N-acetyltransferase